MMNSKNLVALLLTATLTLALPAVAGQKHEREPNPVTRMLKGLDLTDAQHQQIKTLIETAKAKRPDPADRLALHQAMQALVKADQFDAQAARQLLEKQQDNQLNMQIERLRLQHDIRALLTDEQKAKLDERMEKMRQRMEHFNPQE